MPVGKNIEFKLEGIISNISVCNGLTMIISEHFQLATYIFDYIYKSDYYLHLKSKYI